MTKSLGAHKDFGLGDITTYRAGVIQSQAHRRLKKEFSDFLQPHGLTMMEWFALGLIFDSKDSGLRLTALAHDLRTTLPYTTNLINRLMYKGFVLRDSDQFDSRAKIVKIAPGVIKKCNAIEADLRIKMREIIYHAISPDELSAYIKVLYKIADNT